MDVDRRFGGIARLYGPTALPVLMQAHVCVIGVGGVGSWVAEALARSGVGRLTLIDLDHVAESNINRQIHALETTIGQAKVLAMAERIRCINPQADVQIIDEFITVENASAYLKAFDLVVDAIDQVRAKAAIAAVCRDREMKLIMAGGAGGKVDPTRICLGDLVRTEQDPLLSRVRALLRKEYGFGRGLKKKWGIDVVYSTEPVRYPVRACETDIGMSGLACTGYGSSMMMTASFGLFIAARSVEQLLSSGVEADGKRYESV